MLRTHTLPLLVSVTLVLFGLSTANAKPITDIRSVILGDYNYNGCAITTASTLMCFGEIAGRQAQGKSGENKNLPVQIFASGVSDVAIGSSHACAIVNSALLCWGENDVGQVGTGKAADFVSTPTKVIGSGVTAVSAKSTNTCAIVSGALWCWGSNSNAQVGTGTAGNFIASPTQVVPSGVTAVAAGSQHTCAAINGALKCWGYLAAPGSFESTPSKTEFIASGVSAAAAALHTCAIANGSLLCWGRNLFGEVGAGNEATDKPKIVLSGGVTALSVSEHNTCAIAQGALYCWGANSRGQLGTGYRGAARTPQKIIAKGVSAVSISEFQACAVVDGILQCTVGGMPVGTPLPNWGIFTANKTPLTIPEPELPRVEYYGVWRGTIGKQEVMALLGKEHCQASYYYLRHQISIGLQGKDKTGLTWTESAQDSTANWKLEPTKAGALEGKWTSADGQRSVPIKMKRVTINTASSDECSNQVNTYDAPRIEAAMQNLTVTNSTAGPLVQRTLSVLNNQLTTFEIPPGKFNVPRLNKALRDSLRGELSSHYSCTDQAGRNGGDYTSDTSASELVAGYLLSIRTTYNAYCGGAHPDAWSGFGMWNLETDQAVAPSTWIRHDKSKYGGTPILPEKLIDLIYAVATGQDSESENECNDFLRENATYSSYSIGGNGLIFHIHYPHVIQACDQDITVPYAKLTPFLTPEGKKSVTALKQHMDKR